MGEGLPVTSDVREFVRLVDELSDLEHEATRPGGLGADTKARRIAVERRLMHLLGADLAADERRGGVRVVTELIVKVRVGTTAAPGRLADLGAGGGFVETGLTATIGDNVELTLTRAHGTLPQGFQLRGGVAWRAAADGRRLAGLGIAFTIKNREDERRLRRFVLDVLREHPCAHPPGKVR